MQSSAAAASTETLSERSAAGVLRSRESMSEYRRRKRVTGRIPRRLRWLLDGDITSRGATRGATDELADATMIRAEVCRRAEACGAIAVCDYHLPGGGVVDVVIASGDVSVAVWAVDDGDRTLNLGGNDGRRLDGFDFAVVITSRYHGYSHHSSGEPPRGLAVIKAYALHTTAGIRTVVTQHGHGRSALSPKAVLSVLRARERTAARAEHPQAPRAGVVAALRTRLAKQPALSLSGQIIRDAWRARADNAVGAKPALLIEELSISGLSERYDRDRESTIADFAVVRPDGFHLTEIKGENDSFARLARQVRGYNLVAQTATIIVTDERRAAKASDLVPSWWSIVIARADAQTVAFETMRSGTANPDVSEDQLRSLLHRRELERIVKWMGGRAGRLYSQQLAKLVAPFLDAPTAARTLAYFMSRRGVVSWRRGAWESRNHERWPAPLFPEQPLLGVDAPRDGIPMCKVGRSGPDELSVLPLFAEMPGAFLASQAS